jgi:hypothetical protein
LRLAPAPAAPIARETKACIDVAEAFGYIAPHDRARAGLLHVVNVLVRVTA